MTTKMLINAVDEEEYRVAMIKDGLLDGFYIETTTAEQKVGNVYKGIVERIEPSLQACFVNFGDEKNGFLQASEIHPEYHQQTYETGKDEGTPPIDKIVKKGQELLVQVTKEMPGRKGAQLTTYLSLAGRYLVLTPGKVSSGISRKIEDEEERERLRGIMNQFSLPEGTGYIVRTAAMNQSKRGLSKDFNRLMRIWKDIRNRAKKAPPGQLVHKEQDICFRTLRDYFSSEITEIWVDDTDIYAKVRGYMKLISPMHQRRVKFYKERRPLFAHFEIEKQLENLYMNRVPLKSGGSIVIDPTEALISIDVNSGRGKGGKDLETTAFNTNMEAAVEIARQLRLRDMGGLGVIDFIDMRDKKHIKKVEKTLRDESRQDRAKIEVSNISKFGLLEFSRQRLRPSLEARSYQVCPYCGGRGLVQSVESASVSYLRQIWMGASKKGISQVKGVLPLEIATYLHNKKRKELLELETRFGVEVILQGDPKLSPGNGKLEFVNEKNAGEKSV